MPSIKLPLDERLRTAGQLVVRAKIFYDLWFYYEGRVSRSLIFETMDYYSEFFQFDSHAHLTAFIVSIAVLFEDDVKTISFRALRNELCESALVSAVILSEIDALLDRANAKPIIKLRHNVFAHCSAMRSYSDVFKIAAATPNQFDNLLNLMLQIANAMLKSQGLNEEIFSDLPLEDAREILQRLSADN